MRIENSNSVQQISAINAFKNNKNAAKPEEEQIVQEQPNGTEVSGASALMDKIDVNDIKQCARSVGEFDLTDEDIKYGLLYGRSVIAEWLC